MEKGENSDKKVDKKSNKDIAFVQILFKALVDKRLSLQDTAVLTAINSFADNKTGKCYPTLEQIAERAKVGLTAVKKAKIKLIELGYLVLIAKGNSQRANEYRVVRSNAEVDRLAIKAPVIDNIILMPKAKKKVPLKKVTKKVPAMKQEPIFSEAQYIISHWVGKASNYNMEYCPTDKDIEVVNELLGKHTLVELKALISFVWDVYEVPKNKPNLKAEMDINILHGGKSFTTGIINSYKQYMNDEYNPSGRKPREWREIPADESRPKRRFNISSNDEDDLTIEEPVNNPRVPTKDIAKRYKSGNDKIKALTMSGNTVKATSN